MRTNADGSNSPRLIDRLFGKKNGELIDELEKFIDSTGHEVNLLILNFELVESSLDEHDLQVYSMKIKSDRLKIVMGDHLSNINSNQVHPRHDDIRIHTFELNRSKDVLDLIKLFKQLHDKYDGDEFLPDYRVSMLFKVMDTIENLRHLQKELFGKKEVC